MDSPTPFMVERVDTDTIDDVVEGFEYGYDVDGNLDVVAVIGNVWDEDGDSIIPVTPKIAQQLKEYAMKALPAWQELVCGLMKEERSGH